MFLDRKGLTSQEAQRRLEQYGENVLPEKPPPSDILLFLSQLKDPLVYVLIFSGIVTLILRHIPDSLIIFLSVGINTILGFIQEKKANQAFWALKKFIIYKSEVLRDGEKKRIETSKIVPGDLIILSQGTKIPADGKLVFVNRAYFNEAIITGESEPVSKKISDEVFMGATVTAGQALMEVGLTGSKTRIGSIAKEIQEVQEETPLRKQLSDFSKKLVIVVLLLLSFVFIIGILRGEPVIEIFTTSVALAVSSIPEGLLVSLTVVLAFGMQKILKRKGLVRKLESAETLGGVTTICIDKTGTLTEGKMQVVEFSGNEKDLARQMLIANDLDDPIVIAAYDWAKNIDKEYDAEYKRIDSIPFSPKDRFFASINEWDSKKNMLFVNGAPEVLVEWSNLGESEKSEILAKIKEMSVRGRRIIGLARKEIPKTKREINLDDVKKGLDWVGLLAFFDPVRSTVADALKMANFAHVKIIVITGDYAETAKYVLSEIGMKVSNDEVIEGRELSNLSLEGLSKRLHKVKLFARTTPDQKYKIIQALKKNGEVVSMMGDGVNDAPAIHEADIGIVVNDASDVSRESADLVLLDSNFSTIISTIEEGRVIFENIRKIILYLMCDAFSEIVVVIGGIALGLPLPVTAIQIIWINLVSDGFPGIALTIDPKRADIMKDSPKSFSEKLVTKWMIVLISIVSTFAGIAALLTFYVTYKISSNLELARSMAFITLGLNSLSYVFSVRSLKVPFWKNHLFENKVLILAVLGGFFLQLIPFINRSTREFFGVAELRMFHFLIAIFLSIAVFFVVEIFKFANSFVKER
ncbi:MAG: HAD-IC family P-type ATPase [Candidatus Woesebacteria bacterium]|nr:MAG: HAD-IC family P-type ATPase [Candidatus Woesebacteria bacterium]